MGGKGWLQSANYVARTIRTKTAKEKASGHELLGTTGT